MYMKLAEHTTDYFIGKKLINESERDIYVYSFEVLISDLVYFMIAFLTALISGTLIETLLFFLGFFSIRRFAGGFHASSYKRCHLFFWLNQVMMVILLRITDFSKISILILILYAASLFSVFSLAPIANENKPFTVDEAKRFGLLSRVMIILTAVVTVGLYILNVDRAYLFVYIFGVFSASAALIAEKIKITIAKEGDKYGKKHEIS